MGTLKGTVRGVCAIPPGWHSGTFHRITKTTLEALVVTYRSEGGWNNLEEKF